MAVNARITASNLRVLVADEDPAPPGEVRQTVSDPRPEATPYAVSVREAAELIATEEPDLAFVMAHQDDEHALALIGEAVEYASGPVIAHIHGGDVDFIARAAERGISAWIESTSPESVQGA